MHVMEQVITFDANPDPDPGAEPGPFMNYLLGWKHKLGTWIP